MTNPRFPLTLYFDGTCPLCVAEMNQLRLLNSEGQLCFVDIYAADFAQRYPHIDAAAADRYLHAEYADGKMIYGLDVTCGAWSAVNRKRWLVALRWPIVRWFADLAYNFFARNRYSISWLLTGQKRCDRCVSSPDKNSTLQQ